MGEITEQRSSRASLLGRLGLAVVFLLALGGISVWVIHSFIVQPVKTVILPPDAVRSMSPSPGRAIARAPRSTNGNPTITGKVIDASTHEPIPHFTAWIGSSYRGTSQTYFQEEPKQFAGGQYKLIGRNSGFDTWYVRVQADGHLPMVSAPLRGPWTADFELTAAPDLEGRVLAPDGSPAANITVAAAVPGLEVSIYGGKLGRTMNVQTVSDAAGKYRLPPQSGRYMLAAFGDAGCVDVDQDMLARSPDLHLTAWAGVEGRLLIGSKPGAGKEIAVLAQDFSGSYADRAQVDWSEEFTTDGSGHFKADHIRAGSTDVRRLVMRQFGSRTMGTYSEPVTFTARAGQTVTVTVGGVGRSVIGRLIVPKNFRDSADWIDVRVTGQKSFLPPQMPDRVKNASPAARQFWMNLFLLTPVGKHYEVDHPQVRSPVHDYAMEIDKDRHFRIDNFPPGDGEIDLTLFSSGYGQSSSTIVNFVMPDIPGGVSDEPLVLPDVMIAAIQR